MTGGHDMNAATETEAPQGAKPRLVALVGAESSGKTTLAKQLAACYRGLWVPEYLREFCQQQRRTPAQGEQKAILQAQAAREDAAIRQAQKQGVQWLFCDASTLMTAIYSDYVFADASLYPQARQLHQRYACTLLLSNDVPWQPDGFFRDGAHTREPVWNLLHHCLQQWQVPFALVGGTGQQRLLNAVNAVQSLVFDGSAP